MTTEQRHLISVSAVAKILNVSLKSTYTYIESGQLPAFRVGGLIRVDRADVEAFIRPYAPVSDR